MIQLIINFIGIRSNSRACFTTLLRFAVRVRNLLKKPAIQVDVEAIRSANMIPTSSLQALSPSSLCLLLVVTEKDFHTLPMAISSARNSVLSDTEIPVVLIVPDYSVPVIEILLNDNGIDNFRVIDENSIADHESRTLLRNTFQTRYGWALQQLLKVSFVANSSYKNVLVCDADTLLINVRPWVNLENQFILFPSYERNSSYYRFLEKAFNFGGSPRYSFVSHHMFYSRDIMCEALEKYGIFNFLDLAKLVVRHSDQNSSSPYSIDYEFYGQYLYNFHYENLTLLKWSNLPMPASAFNLYLRSSLLRLVTKNFFNSISFHSWS
jgi:hypothetical protein